jgi:proton-dependent oligopeptide transporter, POT family
MWERFSYHGMRAFLILYMSAPLSSGGLGFSDADAASVYGTYTGAAWTAAIFGGLIADRWLGQHQSVLLGAIFIALGHFTLTIKSNSPFYTGLVLIVIGTGLLKPNISALVGSLYDFLDERRDAAFSIFYMGINLGGFIGPLLAGYVAQRIDWRAGFAVTGIGMTVGLVQYVVGRSRLTPARNPIVPIKHESPAPERKRIGAIIVLLVFAAVFWGAYEQAGSTLNFFADRYVRLTVLGLSFPSTWFQAVPSLMVIVFAPVFAWLWIRLGKHSPSSPTKFGFGLLFAAAAFLLMVPAGIMGQQEGIPVSSWWLVGFYLVLEFGELCLSPVGLSLVTKLAPAKLSGLMMGIWFLASAIGSKLAGYAAGLSETHPLSLLFSRTALVCFIAAIIMFVLGRRLQRLL